MKVLLFAIGTRGDIEPFLAIAQLLRERDCDVVCVFPEQFKEMTLEMDVTFRGFSKDFLELLESKEAKMFMGGQGSFFRRIGFLIKLARNGKKLSNDIISLQHQIQEEEQPDRILYHPKCNYSLLWGMANPGKSMLVSPVPGVAHPIRHTSILGNYGRVLNVFSVKLGNVVKAIMLKRYSNRYRDHYQGQKPGVSAIMKVMLRKENTLYAISNSLFPKPDYWPSNAHMVGYHERDKTINWHPDQELLNFLAKHEKIVFISFGSMTNSDPAEKTRIITEVLKNNRVPAIINISWGGLEQINPCPDHIHFVNNIPYDWIFSRVYAVVHHGGSGTTHTALKYACPSLIIPHIIDQFFWRRIIIDLELGPDSASIKKLNEINFEQSLLALLNNESYQVNARTISEKMKKESNKERLYELIVRNDDNLNA